MKKMVCEICQSMELQKQNGVFVCKSCGTEYSVEDARALLVEVDDDSVAEAAPVANEIDNIRELARRAKDTENNEQAAKYYEMLLMKDPFDWESNFYSVYFVAMCCTIGEIAKAAKNVKQATLTSLDLVKRISDPEERSAAIYEIAIRANYISQMLFNAATNHFEGIDSSIQNNYLNDFIVNTLSANDIADSMCDKLAMDFVDDEEVFCNSCIIILKDRVNSGAAKQLFVNAIKRYEPDFEPPKKEEPEPEPAPQPASNTTSSGGCYVATCVYGSYDCPQVWTLRRFRDNTLSTTACGRAFIKAYYAVSPTLVKWFGDTVWFKKMWQGTLDRMVRKLNAEGVKDTPYTDRQW